MPPGVGCNRNHNRSHYPTFSLEPVYGAITFVSGCIRKEPAMDFLSANAANLQGVPDPEVLSIAAAFR